MTQERVSAASANAERAAVHEPSLSEDSLRYLNDKERQAYLDLQKKIEVRREAEREQIGEFLGVMAAEACVNLAVTDDESKRVLIGRGFEHVATEHSTNLSDIDAPGLIDEVLSRLEAIGSDQIDSRMIRMVAIARAQAQQERSGAQQVKADVSDRLQQLRAEFAGDPAVDEKIAAALGDIQKIDMPRPTGIQTPSTNDLEILFEQPSVESRDGGPGLHTLKELSGRAIRGAVDELRQFFGGSKKDIHPVETADVH